MKAVSEANLTPHDMVQVGIDITTMCGTPLILDGAGGWGDPMHIRRTIALAERAGFAGIEIEDQVLPKRVHHHIGIERHIPQELMVAKIREAVAARTNPDFIIIGRTNTGRHDMDEALRRAEAYHKAGADMLLSFPCSPEQMRTMGERLPSPLMAFVGPGQSLGTMGISVQEMEKLGFRLLADAVNPLVAVRSALGRCYSSLAKGEQDKGVADSRAELDAILKTIDFATLLEIEKRTVEA
jgi:methylisocitrate lyase